MTACRVCEQPTEPFASAVLLGSVDAEFSRCRSCGLVMAIDPTWLDLAYSDAIAAMDIGLLDRCLLLSNITATILRGERLTGKGARCLDWAGGYGTLTRLMRDRGYDFEHFDPLADNVFAEGHDVGDLDLAGRYDLVTAFEVLEHLEDPVGSLQPVAATTSRLLATTQLLPDPAPAPGDWWYYTLETGQHITFYTPRALEELAVRLGFDGVVTGTFLHLFYRGRISPVTRRLVSHPGVAYGLGLTSSLLDRRRSLLAADVERYQQDYAAKTAGPGGNLP